MVFFVTNLLPVGGVRESGNQGAPFWAILSVYPFWVCFWAIRSSYISWLSFMSILSGYAWRVPVVCLVCPACAWGAPGMCLGCAWGVPGYTHQAQAKRAPSTPRHTPGTPKAHPKHAQAHARHTPGTRHFTCIYVNKWSMW